MAGTPPHIQFVISSWFFVFLILAGGFFGGGYWLYTHQPPPPPPPAPPPYYVNRITTAVRPCSQCMVTAGKMKPKESWKLGVATDTPPDKQWWFAPVEEPPNPVKIDGIPMLALHPATDQDKPWYGFNQRQVVLVVFQDLEPKFAIDHPPPTPAEPVPVPQPSDSVTSTKASIPDAPPTATAPQQP